MTSLEHLVARQLELCELRRRLEQESAVPPPALVKGVGYGPCLLISRECGSGGMRLARLVSERLGWQIFDRELVEAVARSAHVLPRLIASVDERIRSGWREFGHRLAEGEGIGREAYLYHLRQVIVSFGHHGNVIIVGRGANYILPPECAVSVRLVAPLESRSRRWAERENVSLNRARHRLEQIDAERATFVREAFSRDVNSAENYDLVLNTGELGLEAVAELVLAKLQAKLHVPAERTPCGK